MQNGGGHPQTSKTYPHRLVLREQVALGSVNNGWGKKKLVLNFYRMIYSIVANWDELSLPTI